MAEKKKTGRIFAKQTAIEQGASVLVLPGAAAGAGAGVLASKGGRALVKAARGAPKGKRLKMAQRLMRRMADRAPGMTRSLGRRALVGGTVGALGAGVSAVALGARSGEKARKKHGLGGKPITFGNSLLVSPSLRLARRSYRANRGKPA